MEKYKSKFKESFLEKNAVDLIYKNLSQQVEKQIEDANYEPIDLEVTLSFSDFVNILLYACDYNSGVKFDSIVRNFLAVYTEVDHVLFQDQSGSNINRYEKVIKQNFNNLKIDYKSFSEVIAEYFYHLNLHFKDKMTRDYWKEYFPYTVKEWMSDLGIIINKKVVKKGYETVIEFK